MIREKGSWAFKERDVTQPLFVAGRDEELNERGENAVDDAMS